MLNIKKIVLFFLAAIVISGCSQTISVRVLEPSQIERAASTKKISVVEFKNDSVGLSNKIEAQLANKKIDNKNYFTMISRKDFKKIIDEQKIQNSGLVNVSDAVEVGNLIGAEAIISGSVSKVASNDTNYLSERIGCADNKCKTFTVYKVRCTKRIVSLSADIRMIDVAKGDIIYADTISKSSEFSHCSDDSTALPSAEIAARKLSDSIATNFTYKLTPYYRYFEVVLLEKPDIDYGDNEKKLLEVSLEYIKQNRYDKAEKYLVDLIDSTSQKSYVPFYNLGVVKEAQGDYAEAQKYYNIADEMVIEPVEEVSLAYVRIQNLIEKSSIAKEQLSK